MASTKHEPQGPGVEGQTRCGKQPGQARHREVQAVKATGGGKATEVAFYLGRAI